MEEHVEETIGAFGLCFTRPKWWCHRIERDGDHDTYLYWDEYTGSFRVTPMRPAGDRFRIDEFLARTCERERAHRPEWRTVGQLRFLTYVADQEDGTRIHYFLTGAGEVLVVCSFAYDHALLDDELTADELDGALEEVESILESMTLRSPDCHD